NGTAALVLLQTCRNAAVVCEAFDVSRRRDTLSISHHVEVAALPSAQADALLDWVEETIAATGKPRSTREPRREIARLRTAAATDISVEPEPTSTDVPPVISVDDIELVGTVHGETVVSALSDEGNPSATSVRTDPASSAHADAQTATKAG